jgi:hypothetical protein
VTAKPATAKPATAKPSVSELGIDLAAQVWRRSGRGDGAIEVAFARTPAPGRDRWVLMRVAGDPERRVLVFDHHEWECFLDGARQGEFDDAADGAAAAADATDGAADATDGAADATDGATAGIADDATDHVSEA